MARPQTQSLLLSAIDWKILKFSLDFHLGPRSLAMKSMIGDGIFTQDGAAWKKHPRELLRHQFVRMQY